VSVPAVVAKDEGRPDLPPPRKRVGAIMNGGEKPRAAPRTGKAARPLPPLPVSYVLENHHVEGNL
jgi:hypothetical protein